MHYLGTINFERKKYRINHIIVEALTTGRMMPSGTNSLPAEESTQSSNNNVDVAFCVHEAFLEQPSSGTLNNLNIDIYITGADPKLEKLEKN